MDQLQQYSSLADVQQKKKKEKNRKEKKTFNVEVILASCHGPLYLHFHHGLQYTQVEP